MDTDAGFDMVPRLSKGAVDRRNWQSFIKFIKGHYQNDDLVEVKPNYIVFKAGEHPLLPFESHKFLRFSSKISGTRAKKVNTLIQSPKSQRSTLVLAFEHGTRRPTKGEFITGKRSMTRSEPMSRYVMVYLP
jgi:hypothetical protein